MWIEVGGTERREGWALTGEMWSGFVVGGWKLVAACHGMG